MSEKNSKNNTVFIEGYLKENNLSKVSFSNGNEVIRGSITIAISELESYKVSFNINKFLKNGTEAKEFTKITSLLPENTMSIAQYLKTTTTANWSVASNASTKVYIIGRFEEYGIIEDKKEHSGVIIRGIRGGIKTLDDAKPFAPRANFDVDVYIESKEYEEKDGEKTGRILLTGIVSDYRGWIHRVSFVAEDKNVADHVDNNYGQTQTANFKGVLRSIQTTATKVKENNDSWGSAATEQVTTTFIRERVITGGTGSAINRGDEGSATKEDIKSGLVTRDEIIARNTEDKEKRNAYKSAAASTPKPAPKPAPKPVVAAKVTSAADEDDFNFDENDF